MLFLRFTETPRIDLKRNQSIRATDVTSIKDAVKKYGGKENDYIKTKDGLIGQKIDGLCGFALESETLAEALQEIAETLQKIQEGDFIQYLPDAIPFAIYKGEFSSEEIQDGDVFHAEKYIFAKKYTKYKQEVTK